jgi:hypothetical protein
MVMLVVDSIVNVERARISAMCPEVFSGVTIAILQSQCINTSSTSFVLHLLKQIYSEDFGRKS